MCSKYMVSLIICVMLLIICMTGCDESDKESFTQDKNVKTEFSKAIDITNETDRINELKRVYSRVTIRINNLENNHMLTYEGYKGLALLYQVQVDILKEVSVE